MSITDKELLAICNLSNLKMEFANLIAKSDDNGKILSNHTIYSLLKNELEEIEKYDKWKKDFDSKNKIRYQTGNSTYEVTMKNANEIYEYTAKLNKKTEENKENFKYENRSFYNILKNGDVVPVYYDKITLQKEAPIIMEYYERLKFGNEKSRFLNEWEIIYGADYYEIIIEYLMLLEHLLLTKNTNFIATPQKKKEFKDKENIPFREDIVNKKKRVEVLENNIKFLQSSLSLLFLNQDIISILPIKNFQKKILEVLSEINGNFNDVIASIEKLKNEDLLKKLLSNKKITQNMTLANLKVSIEYDNLDIRVVITRNSNKFIVAFNCPGKEENEIIEDLKKGILNPKLELIGNLIDYQIKKNIKDKNITGDIEVYFTGSGEEGSLLSSSCFMVLDEVVETNENYTIRYYNKVFLLNNSINIKELIDFNEMDILNVKEFPISYELTVSEVISNEIKDIFSSIVNVELLLKILILRSISTVLIGVAEFLVSWYVIVGICIVIIKMLNIAGRKLELYLIKKELLNNKILIKKDNYFFVNGDIFSYDSFTMKKFHTINLKYSDLNYQTLEKIFSENTVKIDNNKLFPYAIYNGAKTIYVPLNIAISLAYSDFLSPYLDGYDYIDKTTPSSNGRVKIYSDILNYRAFDKHYYLKLDENNRFVSVISRKLVSSEEHRKYPVYTTPEVCNKWEITIPTFENENLFLFYLFKTFKIQSKYNKKDSSIINSEFVYFKKFNRVIVNSAECSFKRRLMKTQNIDEISDIDYQLFDTKVTEYIYFPYLNNKNVLVSMINENIIGTLLRSIFNRSNLASFKYIDLIKDTTDEKFTAYEFNISLEKLDNYFFNQIKLKGKKYCYEEHYRSIMNIFNFKTQSEQNYLIRKFYSIEVERKKTGKYILKIGILDGKDYSRKEIGYIYNKDDKLLGRAVEIIVYDSDGSLDNDVTTTGVCHNATLSCNCGDRLGRLSVSPQYYEYTNGFLDATEKDKTTTGFGKCRILNSTCTPNLLNWENVSIGVKNIQNRYLISTSTIKCKIGGTIKIENSNCKTKLK